MFFKLCLILFQAEVLGPWSLVARAWLQSAMSMDFHVQSGTFGTPEFWCQNSGAPTFFVICFLFYEPVCGNNLITRCNDLGLSCLQKLWKWKLKPKTIVISGARFMSLCVWIGPMTTVSGHQKWSWIYELTNAQPLSHGHLIKSLGYLGQLENEICGAIEQLQNLWHFSRNLFVKI